MYFQLNKCSNMYFPSYFRHQAHPSTLWKIYTSTPPSKKVYIDAPCKIESPVAYFLFSQQPLGGWPRFSIPYTSFADYSTLYSLINISICLFTFRFLMVKLALSNDLKHFSRQKYHRNFASSSNIQKKQQLLEFLEFW